ncbi:MAG: nucleotidyl transferase AbiEii/AbiGii toxin family protein [bacterium]|nr:nucleotidyl transferase AbiEii/AbiGii toxin family protein [bacterium]
MDTHAQIEPRLHYETLPRKTKKALDVFSGQEWLKGGGWYLAGGTALALSAGHRVSVDLDFFTSARNFDVKRLMAKVAAIGGWKTTVEESGTLYGELHGAKVSFVAYPFFVPKQKFIQYGMISVLQPTDIGVMKIVAVSQRGRKRDFFDLYWCAHHVEPLKQIVKRLKVQYPEVAHDYNHILKALIYFEDGESDPSPDITFNVSWSNIKKFFEKEIPRITRELIGLT